MKYYFKIIVLLFFINNTAHAVSAPLETFVSILPQQYLVKSIGGEHVNVTVMVKPGQSPATFEPSPKAMSRYSTADIYFTIGMPFEKVWIHRVASLNQSILVVNTQDKNKTSKKFDPHTWLSPLLIMNQANIIKNELIRLSPQHKAYFMAHFQQLEANISALHDELLALFQNNNKHSFITFHPAFSYFARAYGLTQIAIEVDGKEPSAKQIAYILQQIKDKNVHYILVEKQFNKVIAKTIADSVDAQLLQIDPLALDYLTNMRDIGKKINKALF